MRIIFLLFFINLLSAQENNNGVLLIKEKIIKEGRDAYYKKDIPKLEQSSLKLFHLFKKENDSIALAKYYHFKALAEKIKYNKDSAYYYYNESMNIYKVLKDSLIVGKRLIRMIDLQTEAKDFIGGEINAIEALHYLEPLKAYVELEEVYNRLGLVSEELNQKEEAISYYSQTLKVNKFTGRESVKYVVLSNLGLLYQRRNEHKKAIINFKEGLAYDSLKVKYITTYALLLENLAYSNLCLGKKENVLKQYEEVLAIRKTLKFNKFLSVSYVNLADYFIREKQYITAKMYAHKALKEAKKTHNNHRWLEALEELAIVSPPKEAKGYLQQYIKLNDSLLKKERSIKNNFARIRYETGKKEKENASLKKENEKNEVALTYEKQQKTIGWLLFAASLFGLGFSVLFFVVRRRRLIYENKLQKIAVREKERQQIAKSLHDEVAGDLRMLHQKLQKSALFEEAEKLNIVKENVRDLSHKLSSISFDKVSFKDQVVNLVSDYFEPSFRIKVQGIHDNEWSVIDGGIKRLLYLSMRECIQNCQKHAQATKIVLDFSIHKKNVFLRIIDNGIGFDTNKSKKGIGLQNLEERLEELNGTLTFKSEPNNGAEIYIQIPLHAYKNKNSDR